MKVMKESREVRGGRREVRGGRRGVRGQRKEFRGQRRSVKYWTPLSFNTQLNVFEVMTSQGRRERSNWRKEISGKRKERCKGRKERRHGEKEKIQEENKAEDWERLGFFSPQFWVKRNQYIEC